MTNQNDILPNENKRCLVCHAHAYRPGSSPPSRGAEGIALWPHMPAHTGVGTSYSHVCFVKSGLFTPAHPWPLSWISCPARKPTWHFLVLNHELQPTLTFSLSASTQSLTCDTDLSKGKMISEAIKWHRINNYLENFHFLLYPLNKV